MILSLFTNIESLHFEKMPSENTDRFHQLVFVKLWNLKELEVLNFDGIGRIESYCSKPQEECIKEKEEQSGLELFPHEG